MRFEQGNSKGNYYRIAKNKQAPKNWGVGKICFLKLFRGNYMII
jgi:hypothetical protein